MTESKKAIRYKLQKMLVYIFVHLPKCKFFLSKINGLLIRWFHEYLDIIHESMKLNVVIYIPYKS